MSSNPFPAQTIAARTAPEILPKLWRWSHVDILAASAGINILSLAMPLAILQVYDRIVPNQSHSTLTFLVAGVGVALLLEAILTLLRAHLSSWAGATFEHRVGCAAVDRLLASDMLGFERTGAGVHLDRLAALAQLRDFYSGQAAITLADMPFAVLFMLLIWYLAGPLVLVPIGLVVFFAVGAFWLGKRLRKAIEAHALEDERRFNFILEILTGIHTIKSLGMETLMVRRYERLIDNCGRAEYRVNMLSGEATNLATAAAQAMLIMVAAAGALRVIDGLLTIGGLAACSLLASRAIQPLQKALGMWTRLQTIQVAEQRARSLLEQPLDRRPNLPGLPPGDGSIQLENLVYRYRKDLPAVIAGVDLEIEPGEAVGITGEAGSGKSTLLLLMFGLLEPTSGKIRIDGYDPRRHSSTSLHGRIAYLPQDAQMFEGTVMENIAMFREGAYRAAAMAAAEQVGLDQVIGKLPNGFATKVGLGAIEALPRGITQRIAIARALVDRPRILLFDAANTALDSSGDALVRSLISDLKGQTTLILVSQRPSLLRLADRTYELRDGILHPSMAGGQPILRPVGEPPPAAPPPALPGPTGSTPPSSGNPSPEGKGA